MLTLTSFTTFRWRNVFTRPNASRPILRAFRLPAGAGTLFVLLGDASRRRPRLVLVALRVEDRLHAALRPRLDLAAVVGEEHHDPLPGHDVVLLPHFRVADEQELLVVVVVFRPLGGAGAAVLGDDLHVAGRDDPEDPLALVVEVDLHPVRGLDRVLLLGDDIPREYDETFLLDSIHPLRN